MSRRAKASIDQGIRFEEGIARRDIFGRDERLFRLRTRCRQIRSKRSPLQHGTAVLWQGLPVLVVVLAGGFTTNFIWCVILNIRNRTGYQYFQSEIRGTNPARDEEHILETATDAPGGGDGGRGCRCARDAAHGPPCLRTICSPPWPAPRGTSSSSSTPWAKRRWAGTSSPVGPCTWPASSSSAPCGASR